MKTEIIALHGFLGEPSDWNESFAEIRSQKPDWNLVAVDWVHENGLGSDQNFESWSNKFVKFVEARGPALRTIVGYSLGGRLALHALERKPELWRAAVFLSVNPGLQTAQEKLQRLQSDKEWARRFQEENFVETLKAWNAQEVFRGGQEPDRRHLISSRKSWVQSLENWSLGWQKDFRQSMDFWQIKQLWVAGQKDLKYCHLLKTLPLIPEIQKWEVQEASHRLLVEAPGEVAHFIIRASSPIENHP
jgi:2-succinyl-6-hydroxy-2,4-cyclohexadiene-1-carboxylate synthase